MLAAADFFTIEVWGPRGLVAFYVFFVIELATRRIEIALDSYRWPSSRLREHPALRGTVRR